MTLDPLENLLRDVDAAAGAGPPRDGQLSERVRQLDRRRRRRNHVFVGSAAAVLAVALAVASFSGRRDSAPVSQPVAQELPPDAEDAVLSQFEAEIAKLESQLAVLQASERHTTALGQMRRLTPPPTREEWVRQQLEFSAATVLAGAQVKYERLALTESAMADYRRVSKMYPDTVSAEIATVRLAAISRETPKEPEL